MGDAVDVDSLPPTQYLVMEVLAARHRLGEPFWPFPHSVRNALTMLERRYGLITVDAHPAGGLRASLTDAGKAAVLSPTYVPPSERANERNTDMTTSTPGTPPATLIIDGVHLSEETQRGIAQALNGDVVVIPRELAENLLRLAHGLPADSSTVLADAHRVLGFARHPFRPNSPVRLWDRGQTLDGLITSCEPAGAGSWTISVKVTMLHGVVPVTVRVDASGRGETPGGMAVEVIDPLDRL